MADLVPDIVTRTEAPWWAHTIQTTGGILLVALMLWLEYTSDQKTIALHAEHLIEQNNVIDVETFEFVYEIHR